jgi:hypothetical protein
VIRLVIQIDGIHMDEDLILVAASLDKPPFFLRVVCPDPSKAIGLQLDANLELIGVDLVHAPLRTLHLRQDTQKFCT